MNIEVLCLEAGKMIQFPCSASALGEQLQMGSGPDALTPAQLDHREKTPVRGLRDIRSVPTSRTASETRDKSLYYSLLLIPPHP